MIYRFGIFCSGLGALIDTVLLLALLEPRNFRRVLAPAVGLALGSWLLHVGGFVHGIVVNMDPSIARPLHHAAMTAMAAGLLLMPCALMHIVLRILRTGLVPHPRFDVRYVLLYLPMLLLVPIEKRIAADPLDWFLNLVQPYIVPYIIITTAITIVAASVLLFVRHRSKVPRDRQLFGGLALSLLIMAAVFIATLIYGPLFWRDGLAYLQLIALLAPLIPILMFGYFVIRFNFMRLMVERTLVYGAILVGILLFHWMTVLYLNEQLERAFKIDFGVLEAILLILLVLFVQPIRERTFEALRYLMRREPATTKRDQIRGLSLSLVRQADLSSREMLSWFARELQPILGVEYISAWLFDEAGEIIAREGNEGNTDGLTDDRVKLLRGDAAGQSSTFITPREMPTRRSLDVLQAADASGAMAFDYQEIHGLIVVGLRARNNDFGEEEASALALLIDQLAATMHNRDTQRARLVAERRALQNEKLSTLGLLAGSIVHEIKNPLSSIKTIATVMAEELGPDNKHAEDLTIILGEVRRLADSTGELLDFARPNNSVDAASSIPKVLKSTLRILRHLANTRRVRLTLTLEDDLPAVRLSEDKLQEIFFNLISNAIDAVGENGEIQVTSHRVNGHVVSEVHDNGPGIDSAIAGHVFEPFATTKTTGTGLGLFAVRRRVDEAGGLIEHSSGPTGGTTFRILLPIEDP